MSTVSHSTSSAAPSSHPTADSPTASAPAQPTPPSAASPAPSPSPAPSAAPRPLLNLSKPTNYSGLDNAEEDPPTSAPHQPPTSSTSTASPHLPHTNHLNQPHNSGFTIRKQQPRTGMAPAPYADSSHSKPAPSSLAPLAPSSSAPSSTSPPSSVFPALHLIPLNETFVPKQISLNPPGARVKIGRQTNAKTIPNGSNGYFDSKVLSRMHAEVWSEDGKVLIKDVKSSNGTFIDGQRLSAEAAESDVFELRTGSTVEFGIDIVSDDSKTIVHHKVAAKVHVVMNPDDALASSREFNAWFRNAGDQPSQRRGARPLGGGQQQNGLSFEHVLNRLQGELQKSRDTGSNLGDLSSTLNDVQDTLGGAAPPPNFAASQRGVPPYLPNGHSPNSDHHAQSIAALQNQLNETQTSLAGHVGKIRDLEGLLAEHDVIKREVGSLRKQMEEAKRDMERMMRTRSSDGSAPSGGEEQRASGADGRESPIAKLLEQQEDEEAEAVTDDDHDARSISSVDTISPSNSKVNGVLSAAAGAAAGAASSKLASSPATTSHDDELARSDAAAAAAAKEADLARERQLQEQNAKLSARLETLSAELDEATKLGQSLRSQHAEASSTIRALEERVLGLEKAVEGRVKEVEGKVLKECEGKWQGWREKFEEGWRKERAGWEEEREKLMAVVREWEERRRDSSGSEDEGETDEEDGDEVSRDIGSKFSTGSSATLVDSSSSDATSSTTALSSSPNSSSKSKSRSRRRRRSTATAPGSGSRISKLAKGTSSTVPSDSDSTIGSGEGVGRGVGSWGSATKGSAGVNGFDEANNGQGTGNSQSATSYASAGVVVVIGVVAAYALSLKMKE